MKDELPSSDGVYLGYGYPELYARKLEASNFSVALTKNKLREYREKNGLTQEMLAEKVGVTRQTIISIERGRYIPSLELSLKFAGEFKCKVEELFGL